MTKLNQIVALEKGVKVRVKNSITEIYKDFQKPPLFNGQSRTYQPKDEDGEQLPTETTNVQLNVPVQLSGAAAHLTQLLDVVATKEWGNTQAKASVKIGDRTIVKDAPVPYLLFLEKELIDWRTMVSKLPVLDSSVLWSFDDSIGKYRTEPTTSSKTKKVLRNHVKALATDRHPEQVEVYTEDIPIGTWSLTKFSGAIPAKLRNDLVERVNQLIDAVKVAREEANGTEVQQQKVAAEVFQFLLA